MIWVGVFMLSPRTNLYPQMSLVSLRSRASNWIFNSVRVSQWFVFLIMPSSLWGLVHFQNTYQSLCMVGMPNWVWLLLCTLKCKFKPLSHVSMPIFLLPAWEVDPLVGPDICVLSSQWIYPYSGLAVLLKTGKVMLCAGWKLNSMIPCCGCAVQGSQNIGMRRTREAKDYL